MSSLNHCLKLRVHFTDRLKYLAKNGDADQWRERAIDGHPAHPVLEIISGLRPSLPILAPQEALAIVITACSLADKVVRWSPDSDRVRVRLANLESLIELAKQYEDICHSSQHAASISGLILWFSEIAQKKQDMLAAPAINAVKVMTHHATKGLEWPVVILTDLDKDIKDRLWSVSAQTGTGFDAKNPLANRYIRYWPWPFGRLQNVAVADNIAQTSTATGFRKTAIEESKRLLYVSMTRARDLLVLARPNNNNVGEWLDCIQAPWLLTSNGAGSVTLPTGEHIAAVHAVFEPATPTENPRAGSSKALHWFQTTGGIEQQLPITFRPSSAAPVAATVLETCRIGERIAVAHGAVPSVLGTAIHACIGLSFSAKDFALSEADVRNILSGFNVGTHLSPAAVMRQVSAFHKWLASRWPGAMAHAEIPIQSVMPTKQVLSGRIDLLLETPAGWILIDHKSSQLAPDHWEQLANEYGAQMAAYAQAVEQASAPKKVIESWLFLPVAGGAIRMNFS